MDELKIVKYLSGELSENEAEEVKQWIDHAEHKAEFEKIQQLWNSSPLLKDEGLFQADLSWKKMKLRIDNEKVKPLSGIFAHKWSYAIAGLLVILLGAALFFKYYFQETAPGLHFMTQDRKQDQPVILPDGTRVFLNRYTRVVLDQDFGKDTRTLSLTGEAYFEVAKDKTKPFIIKTATAHVKVVGTSFNVSAYHDQDSVQVAVNTGIVELYSAEEISHKIRLTVGKKGTYLPKNEKLVSNPYFDSNIFAWRTHQLSFKNADLKYVVNMLTIAYGKDIKIKQVKDDSFRWNLNVDHLELDSVLKVIVGTNNLKLTKAGGSYLISSK